RQEQLRPYRERVVSAESGRVLEIGIGSGLNLPLYPEAVDEVVGVDPSPELLRLAAEASRRPGLETDLIKGTAENLPMENGSVDCAVLSWTLCCVAEKRSFDQVSASRSVGITTITGAGSWSMWNATVLSSTSVLPVWLDDITTTLSTAGSEIASMMPRW